MVGWRSAGRGARGLSGWREACGSGVPGGEADAEADVLGSDLALAFALTVHKAQGSELTRVAFFLPEVDVPLLTREIIYTAMTRARSGVVVVGDPALLALGARRRSMRSSGLSRKLAPDTYAVQTDDGLVVPVVRHAEARDLFDSAAEKTRLTEAARAGTATRDELTGSTLTITSLGALGGLVTTPIINHPEVAIVGVNRIAVRPHWDGTAFAPRKIPHAFAMTVALGASTAFMTPVSSPVNALVVGPGGYRFGDFVRIGTPLAVMALIVTVVLVPLVYPV